MKCPNKREKLQKTTILLRDFSEFFRFLNITYSGFLFYAAFALWAMHDYSSLSFWNAQDGFTLTPEILMRFSVCVFVFLKLEKPLNRA
jgi:hypothetical protein